MSGKGAAGKPPSGRPGPGKADRVTLQRAFSKLGICSRKQAEAFILDGRVRVNEKVTTAVDTWVDMKSDRIELDGKPLTAREKVYLALNKPRGLVTTRDDPEGRDTVFDCLEGLDLPFVAPIGRLDKASEGLLLFTNDTQMAQRLLDPDKDVRKIYHVQVSGVPGEAELARMRAGIVADDQLLTAAAVRLLRSGEKNAWLEVQLTEGKNRQIRRMLEALGMECLRLVRVSIGDIPLGDLAKGATRLLSDDEVRSLRESTGLRPDARAGEKRPVKGRKAG
ncbi:23S rRNA pseudouridine2605 synthase [Rhizobium azooxidifex]|uniref:Pseudouridine synthase n=1 Tax=Mycoplana azooxidifex TaxID=1636188 RepID=A0A7W6DCX3_9HYPH|nr:23S rRNA pseudouridine2605 synthase [Mycoplana azooxidifex]